MTTSPWTAGVDGARGGWICALWDGGGPPRLRRLDYLGALFTLAEAPAFTCLDMPIGLSEVATPGGRRCDRAARQRLAAAGGRPSSVFSPPARPALAATTHAEASARNRATGPGAPGLSIQAFHLFPLLRQVDETITPARQERVVEAHPELAFARLAGGVAPPPKRSAEGRARRRALLALVGLTLPQALPRDLGAAWDDVLDACVLAWLAREIIAGRGVKMPQAPDVDARGLRMEIWG